MNRNSKKSVFLITNGCPENKIDMAMIQNFFKKNNWNIVDNYFNSDMIVFNACGLTQFHERQSVRIINTLKTHKPSGANLIICGCLPKINESGIKLNPEDTILYGESENCKFNEIIQAEQKIEEVTANVLYPYRILKRNPAKSKIYSNLLDHLFHVDSEFRGKIGRILWSPLLFYDQWLNARINLFHKKKPTYFIKIATGCLNACTYCAVKKSRGNLKSKSLEKVLEEFRSGLQQGYENFSLLGTDLGPYGKDIGTNLAVLLQEMIRENGNYKIRLRNTEPRWLMKIGSEMIEIFKSKKIPFVGIPIESGNNEILNKMKRGYKIEDVKEFIKELNRKFPFILIRTQLMTGFPGETLEQFYDTYNLIDELFFDYVEVYPFSPRPNTLAAEMQDQLLVKERVRRRNKLWLKALLKNTPQKLRKIYNE